MTLGVVAVTKRVFRDLVNDKRTLAIIFVTPVVAMLLFGFTFGSSVKDAPVVIVNQDRGVFVRSLNATQNLPQNIIANLDTQALHIEYAKNPNEAIGDVENGTASGAIIFPSNFTRNVYSTAQGNLNAKTAPGVIETRIDKSNTNVAATILQSLNDAIATTAQQTNMSARIGVQDNPIYGGNLQLIDFSVPGIMTFALFGITVQLTLLAFTSEKTSGTLHRLFASPLRESEIVFGYGLAFGMIGTLQSALLVAVAIAAFHIIIVGNILIAFGVIVLLATVSQSLGIVISSASKREIQATQVMPMIALGVFLLCGIVWPLEAIPSWLRVLSYLLPPTYAVDAIRSVMLRGWGLDKIWFDVVVLFIFEAVFFTLATWLLKRKIG